MLKNFFRKKAPKERLEKALEHQDVHRGQAEAKARANKLLKQVDQKKRALLEEQAKKDNPSEK